MRTNDSFAWVMVPAGSVRETISRRAAGDSRYPVTPEHVYALRYLLGRE